MKIAEQIASGHSLSKLPRFEYAEDASKLKWRFTEHWSGESAVFQVCGLWAYVKDYDGDRSGWSIRKGRRGPVLAEGEDDWFFQCLHDAEAALRKIIADRIAEIRQGKQQ